MLISIKMWPKESCEGRSSSGPDSFPSLMLHCSVSLVVAVLGLDIVNNSIQNHMSITNTFKFAYSFIRLPKLSACNSTEGLATLLLVPVFLGAFFHFGVARIYCFITFNAVATIAIIDPKR